MWAARFAGVCQETGTGGVQYHSSHLQPSALAAPNTDCAFQRGFPHPPPSPAPSWPSNVKLQAGTRLALAQQMPQCFAGIARSFDEVHTGLSTPSPNPNSRHPPPQYGAAYPSHNLVASITCRPCRQVADCTDSVYRLLHFDAPAPPHPAPCAEPPASQSAMPPGNANPPSPPP